MTVPTYYHDNIAHAPTIFVYISVNIFSQKNSQIIV